MTDGGAVLPSAGRSNLGKERVRQLFRFLRAFAERRATPPTRLDHHPWRKRFSELPRYGTIEIGQIAIAPASEETSSTADEPLLRVRRPKLQEAPKPPQALREWLQPWWEQPTGSIEVIPVLQRPPALPDGEPTDERFEDDPERPSALQSYRTKWDTWAAAERPAREAQRVYDAFFQLHTRLSLEGERVEAVLGDGILRWRHPDGRTIEYPLLHQRVELVFDAQANPPEFRLYDTDRLPELYDVPLRDLPNLDQGAVNQLRTKIEASGCHPLEKETTSGLLRTLVQTIASAGELHEGWQEGEAGRKPLLLRDPVLFLRDRLSGIPAAYERMLAVLESDDATASSALLRLVGVVDDPPGTLDEHGYSPWGEPADVLLSMPANEDQVRIVRTLDQHRAVLVQGPPGTGKSHTIANLIGHLVANGKRVLVTSHTTKALKVLRGQLVDELKPLCVAVLEQDAESRSQLEQSVNGILDRLKRDNPEELSREAKQLADDRQRLNDEIDRLARQLLEAREGEYRALIVQGETVAPADAAREVASTRDGNDWIPGTVTSDSPLPLRDEEVRRLYESNRLLSDADERAIEASLPDPALLPDPVAFRRDLQALAAEPDPADAGFWTRPCVSEDAEPLRALLSAMASTVARFEALPPWQRALAAIGQAADGRDAAWRHLATRVTEARKEWAQANELLALHAVTLPPTSDPDSVARVASDLGVHVSNGGSLGGIALLFRKKWRALLSAARVDDHPPASAQDFRAIVVAARGIKRRAALGPLWNRVAVPVGLPSFDTYGDEPEPRIAEIADQFEECLTWWSRELATIRERARGCGFDWTAIARWHVARASTLSPFERDLALLRGPSAEVVTRRCGLAERLQAEGRLDGLGRALRGYTGEIAVALQQAVAERNPTLYETVHAELRRVAAKHAAWMERRELLARLEAVAPDWAAAVRQRTAPHDAPNPPGAPRSAWRWKQLHQELERRTRLNEHEIAERLEERRNQLRQTTAALIDRLAWRAQLDRTDQGARQALQGWADTVRRIGRGTGRRVPELQAHARALLAQARDAVPVWIMPIQRVAESFDPKNGRFDVVIIDEASQCDITGLFTWQLADRIAVVGDHEQVSPSAVGTTIDEVAQLRRQFLTDVPNEHLYDGTLSVYDCARQAFGGTIALREHFRCVPDIIDFSNGLSYDWQIRPLRNPTVVARPHVTEVCVRDGARGGKGNLMEARWVASLLAAAHRLPAYESKSFGAISLVGDEQADLIMRTALEVVEAAVLEQRRFVAGNSAQFQGDERHVMFLSMVDAPPGNGRQLPINANTPGLKQRYNVAASRARDQLWLVHSLDPGRDLQPGDLRRRLIEHVRDPGAGRQVVERTIARTESPFEREVAETLLSAGFVIDPQVQVGRYRIDLVVKGGGEQVAVECDGDRFHGIDQIPEDMARQAILERAKWRFIRIRGTRWYRDRAGTARWLLDELERRGIRPEATTDRAVAPGGDSGLRDEVLALATQIMRDKGWLIEPDGRGMANVAPRAAEPLRTSSSVALVRRTDS